MPFALASRRGWTLALHFAASLTANALTRVALAIFISIENVKPFADDAHSGVNCPVQLCTVHCVRQIMNAR